MKFDRKKRKC